MKICNEMSPVCAAPDKQLESASHSVIFHVRVRTHKSSTPAWQNIYTCICPHIHTHKSEYMKFMAVRMCLVLSCFAKSSRAAATVHRFSFVDMHSCMQTLVCTPAPACCLLAQFCTQCWCAHPHEDPSDSPCMWPHCCSHTLHDCTHARVPRLFRVKWSEHMVLTCLISICCACMAGHPHAFGDRHLQDHICALSAVPSWVKILEQLEQMAKADVCLSDAFVRTVPLCDASCALSKHQIVRANLNVRSCMRWHSSYIRKIECIYKYIYIYIYVCVHA